MWIRSGCLSMLSLAAAAAYPANDQTPNTRGAGSVENAAIADAGGIAEVIVTAGRVPSTVQDTALTVNVLSADSLEASGVTDTTQLQTQVPNLQYQSATGTSFVYLRGIGSAVFGIFGGNSVATYIDGVYVPQQNAAAQNLFDVDHVEVLRGPQATLYGRNATGGAILIKTTRPQFDFSSSADAQYGNYDALRLRGAVNAPLSDKVAVRLSAVRSRHDGYSTNLATGSDFDTSDYWGFRGAIRFQPSDRLDFTLTAHYTDEDGSPGNSKATQPATMPFLPPPAGRGQPFVSDPRAAYHDVQDHTPGGQWGATLDTQWNAGFADLTATTGYTQYRQGPIVLDVDDTAATLLEYRGNTVDTKFIYQDILLASRRDSGPFEWLLGGTAAHEDTQQRARVLNPGGLPPFTITTTRVDAYALYGQLAYALTSRFKLTGGLRYSYERREGRSWLETMPAVTQMTASWDDVSPRVALEYRPTGSSLVYLSVTKGFKSGTFDPQNVTNVAQPEDIRSYEIGFKNEFLDDRLVLNLSAFHYDYKRLQIFQGVLNGGRIVTFLQNANSADVDGFEMEASYRLNPRFTLGGSLAWLHARYNSGTPLVDTANSVPGRPVVSADVGGNPLPQAPDFTWTAYADWRVLSGSAGHLDLHADYFSQTRRYFTSFKDATLAAPASDVVNARLTYRFPDEKIYVALYGRNLGDTLIYYGTGRVPPFGNSEHYAPPRTYGVEIGTRF
ncbi:MAG: TonB-dependent receptor [Steroidobacteraceae bacterium]